MCQSAKMQSTKATCKRTLQKSTLKSCAAQKLGAIHITMYKMLLSAILSGANIIAVSIPVVSGPEGDLTHNKKRGNHLNAVIQSVQATHRVYKI